MTSPSPATVKTRGGAVRQYFMRGLFVVIPLAVTVWILQYAISLTNSWLGPILHAIAEAALPAKVTNKPGLATLSP